MNDVLEGLVGDLPEPDELDSEYISQREDGTYLLDGLLEVDDLKDLLHLKTLPREDEGDFRTLGGFVTSYMDRIPSESESFEAEGWRFEIVDMDGSRVDKLLVSPEPEALEGRVASETDD